MKSSTKDSHMEILSILKAFIYLISSSLFYPVLFFLSFLFCWMVMQAGDLFYEWLQRKRSGRVSPSMLLRQLREGGIPRAVSPVVKNFGKRLEKALSEAGEARHRELVAVSFLQEAVQSAGASVSWLKVIIRVGPGLGLIGTLIPMGIGLSALGQGDVTRLSSNLVVAFTTTVVGLFEGMLAYLFFIIRQRWINQDISMMETMAEYLVAGDEADEGKAEELA